MFFLRGFLVLYIKVNKFRRKFRVGDFFVGMLDFKDGIIGRRSNNVFNSKISKLS